MAFYVYIMASEANGTLYVGMTDNIQRRAFEHRTGALPGFTRTFGVKRLVFVETHDTRESAVYRERRLKKWNREWKLRLIRESNPTWKDLYEDLGPE